MKKAFTLVEMLIVVVVIVTLMTMTFKLSSINGANSKRNKTVSKLQKVENCLSGYYAAFGTYPAVGLHGSRNPFLKVSTHGIQNLDEEENKNIFNWDVNKFKLWVQSDFDGKYYQNEENNAWRQVQAACRSQPVSCKFPFPRNYGELVQAHSEQLMAEAADSGSMSQERKAMFAAGFDDGVTSNLGRFNPYQKESDWRELQLFQFGLISFLLPRYRMMMQSDDTLYDDFAQWKANNDLPCDPIDGGKFRDWKRVCHYAQSTMRTDLKHIDNIPSQAQCARWLPNLAGCVYSPHSLKMYGVDLREEEDGGFSTEMEIYSPGGYDNSSTAQQYVLDFCTIRDGWWNEIFYYSPPPYQTYVVWSAGPNKRTFPPWIARDKLGQKENQCIGAWTEDDIMSMSH